MTLLECLVEALSAGPQPGAWVADASCADLGTEGASVFTSDHPDPDELALAEGACWRATVRSQSWPIDVAARSHGSVVGTRHADQSSDR